MPLTFYTKYSFSHGDDDDVNTPLLNPGSPRNTLALHDLSGRTYCCTNGRLSFIAPELRPRTQVPNRRVAHSHAAENIALPPFSPSPYTANDSQSHSPPNPVDGYTDIDLDFDLDSDEDSEGRSVLPGEG